MPQESVNKSNLWPYARPVTYLDEVLYTVSPISRSYKMHKYFSRARVDAHADHTSMKTYRYTRVKSATLVANFIFLLSLN